MSAHSVIPVLSGDAASAVAHRNGHLQIIASAGSGKTETVSQRIASLIAEGANPASVVAFTFTERAAHELKSRVRARVEHFAGPTAADRLGAMYIGTIHGYCFHLLTTHVGRYESYGVMDENQQAAFIQRNSHRLQVRDLAPGGQIFAGIAKLRESVDVVENEMLEIDDLPDPLKSSITTYYSLLESHRLLTFGRQIGAAIEALEDPEVHRRVTENLHHLIVDEYQDVNPAQERLIQLLSKPLGHADLVVVGDDDQAIYQWRGSSVQNITTFADRYPNVTTFKLLANRRSRPPIVVAANEFARSIPGRLDKEMLPSRDLNGPAIDIVGDFETEAIEARELATTIQRLHRNGYAYSDMAVLVRGRTSYPAILEAFEEHQIPVQPGGRVGLFEQSDADFLGRCFSWLVDYEWRKGRFNPVKETVTIESLRSAAKSLFRLDESEVDKFARALIALKERVGNDSRQISLVEETYELLRLLGLAQWDETDAVLISRLGTIARFQTFVADYEAMQMRARSDDEGQVGAADQKDFYFKNLAALMLNFAIHDYTDFEGEEDLLTDSVEMMTVHAAKGLEWPVVFLPSLTKKRFPSSNTGKQRDWLVPTTLFDRHRYEGSDADERRLFYVAMTRAREWLSLSAHQKVTKSTVQPSPYIQEVAAAHRDRLDFPSPAGDSGPEQDPDLFVTYSDVAAYLTCGYSYWLRSRIGFPAAIVEEIGYGNAVHHLMRAIAEESKRRGKPLDSADIDRLMATDFFLPYANRAAAANLAASARRLVDTYMSEHSDDMRRVWETERPFELALPGVVVSGRADVILDRGEDGVESLAIVDYKTAVDDRDLGLQLQVYTLAGLREGLHVEGAYLHDLGRAARTGVDTSTQALDQAAALVADAADGIKQRRFEPSPETSKCARCDVRSICRSRAS